MIRNIHHPKDLGSITTKGEATYGCEDWDEESEAWMNELRTKEPASDSVALDNFNCCPQLQSSMLPVLDLPPQPSNLTPASRLFDIAVPMVESHSPYQETMQSLPKTAESTPKSNCTSLARLPILSPSDLPSQQTPCVDETLAQHPPPLRPLQYHDCYNCKDILSVAVGSTTELLSCELKKYFVHYLTDDGKSLLSNLCRDKYRHFCGDNTVYLNLNDMFVCHFCLLSIGTRTKKTIRS